MEHFVDFNRVIIVNVKLANAALLQKREALETRGEQDGKMKLQRSTTGKYMQFFFPIC